MLKRIRYLAVSHGFGPPSAADAPDPSTKQALLSRGYALAGSSYDPNGSWAHCQPFLVQRVRADAQGRRSSSVLLSLRLHRDQVSTSSHLVTGILVDLDRVGFMDSSGLHVLLARATFI
jgi:hypothetical protein